MTVSWPELVGRNIGAAMTFVAGRMTSTTPDGTDLLDFWHGGADRWRVERDGDLLHLSDGRTTAHRDESGKMVPITGRGIRVAWTTAGFGPPDLIGPSGCCTSCLARSSH